MNDRPTATELLAAARHFLESELLPTLTDARLRYQTLVAANVLAIASRELNREEAMLSEEEEQLGMVLGETIPRGGSLGEARQRVQRLNRTWCTRIRAGEYDEPARWRDMAALARQQVVRKLEVANPRQLPGDAATPGEPKG